MSARFWMFVPVLLLGSTVAFAAWRIALVVNDPSFAEEAQAYERGLDWDAEMERRAQQADLGWTVHIAPPPVGSLGEVLVQVLDRDGAAVSGLTGRASSFYNATPSARHEIVLAERAPGLLVGAITPDRPGLWQWQLELLGAAGAWSGSLRAEIAP